MAVLLTSAGLETKALQESFLSLITKDMSEVKALFIPTAAIDPEAIAMLPKCRNDLLKCGISDENITVYDLHTGISPEELQRYDLVYLCGGSTEYLLERVNTTGFHKALKEYIQRNGLVIGVSAGSIIFAENLRGNLGLLPAKLAVHCVQGEEPGKLTNPLKVEIRLTNTRALLWKGAPEGWEIVGE